MTGVALMATVDVEDDGAASNGSIDPPLHTSFFGHGRSSDLERCPQFLYEGEAVMKGRSKR
jgi:hypothetical protein